MMAVFYRAYRCLSNMWRGREVRLANARLIMSLPDAPNFVARARTANALSVPNLSFAGFNNITSIALPLHRCFVDDFR